MREMPFMDKGEPTEPCPWPDEPVYIDAADYAFVIKHGGELTRKLANHAFERGYLKAEKGYEAQLCMRCTWVGVGEHQHLRDEWHHDNAIKGWLYIEGVAPTEVKFDTWNSVHTVPTGVLFPYHGLEHRCPRATEAGWRYFFRILHAKRGGRNMRGKARDGTLLSQSA